MLRKNRKKLILVILTVLVIFVHPKYYLTLRNRDTRNLYAKYELDEGEWFSVGYIHSVNKSPVIDYYQIENKTIYGEECLYYAFGAGVQTELNPGETLSYTEDKGMLISNIHHDRTNMGYIVGTVSDHTLCLYNMDRELIEEISLRTLCGRNAPVRFNYELCLF